MAVRGTRETEFAAYVPLCLEDPGGTVGIARCNQRFVAERTA
jgi:hypothetical protein